MQRKEQENPIQLFSGLALGFSLYQVVDNLHKDSVKTDCP